MSDSQSGAAAEMPKYRSHKLVWALKIAKVENTLDFPEDLSTAAQLKQVAAKAVQLHFEPESGIKFSPLDVSFEWSNKHRPHVGGYYVQYQDGYTSFSPAAAFEQGYTRIEKQSAPVYESQGANQDAAATADMATYAQTLTENLTYGQALEALFAGKTVARAVWGGYWRIEKARFTEGNAPNLDIPLAYTKWDTVEPAQPYWVDMRATDWRIISDEEAKQIDNFRRSYRRLSDEQGSVGFLSGSHAGTQQNAQGRDAAEWVAGGC